MSTCLPDSISSWALFISGNVHTIRRLDKSIQTAFSAALPPRPEVASVMPLVYLRPDSLSFT